MTFSKLTTIRTHNHRGISSIVGGILFFFLMTVGFSVLSIALSSQYDSILLQQKLADIELKKIQEDFSVSISTNKTDIKKE